MAEKKGKREISFAERMRKFIRSGLEGSKCPNPSTNDVECLPSIDERISRMLGIVNDVNRKPTNMLFFVMYDIESNKVRNQVVKYLIKKGCTRVQAAYDNQDSILVVPLSTDYLRAMKIIGQNISLDMITHSRSTLFF